MQRILSTHLYISQKLTPGLLAEIERASIPAIEIYCARTHFDYRSAAVLRELAEWFPDHRLTVHSLHAPTSRDFAPGRESGVPMCVSDPERVRRLDAVDEVKRALDVAEYVRFRYLVLHLGAGREEASPARYDAAFNSLEHLAVFAKQRGVTIALENTPGELASPANLRHFIQDTRLGDLRLCFDAGHAHMEEGVERSFEAMREFIVTADLHDNHGERDEHLLPYQGTIDWSALLRALRSSLGAAGALPVVLELKKDPGSLSQATAVFEKLAGLLAAKGAD